MKNRWKHIFIPVPAMALCLSLAACGNSDDVAGEDWRTTGVVVGSGTITHDGESVDVLVTADPNSAAFYRDQEEQVLFDSVAFPETIEDISSSAFQISFDDQNGDEESDVLVEIGHEDMSNTTMLWLWAPQERYVYQPDYSSFHVPGVAGPEEPIAPYVGLWEYQGENLWLRIHEDATWEFVNDQDDVIEYGTLWVDENGVTLHFDGSGDTLQLDCTVSGDLIDSVNGGTLLPVEGIQSSEPYFTRNGLEINAAVERGTFLLEDGVCSYSGLGDGYNTGAIGRSRRTATIPMTASASCTSTPSVTFRRTPFRIFPRSTSPIPTASCTTSTPACGSPPQRLTATASGATTTISTPSAGRETAISLNSPTPPTGSTTWGTGRRS